MGSRSLKRLVGISGLVLSAAFLAACGLATSPSKPASGAPTDVTQKVGDTTKTGTVTQNQGRFYLTVPGQPPQEIDSYSLDLASYVGQSITVKGQFSGDTLFVGSIQ